MTVLCFYGVAFLFLGFAFYYFIKGIGIKSKDYLKASGIKFIKGIILFILAFLLGLFYKVGEKINASEGKIIINLPLIDSILLGLIIALGIYLIIRNNKKRSALSEKKA